WKSRGCGGGRRPSRTAGSRRWRSCAASASASRRGRNSCWMKGRCRRSGGHDLDVEDQVGHFVVFAGKEDVLAGARVEGRGAVAGGAVVLDAALLLGAEDAVAPADRKSVVE